jgi:hypothetical protein
MQFVEDGGFVCLWFVLCSRVCVYDTMKDSITWLGIGRIYGILNTVLIQFIQENQGYLFRSQELWLHIYKKIISYGQCDSDVTGIEIVFANRVSCRTMHLNVRAFYVDLLRLSLNKKWHPLLWEKCWWSRNPVLFPIVMFAPDPGKKTKTNIMSSI